VLPVRHYLGRDVGNRAIVVPVRVRRVWASGRANPKSTTKTRPSRPIMILREVTSRCMRR